MLCLEYDIRMVLHWTGLSRGIVEPLLLKYWGVGKQYTALLRAAQCTLGQNLLAEVTFAGSQLSEVKGGCPDLHSASGN